MARLHGVGVASIDATSWQVNSRNMDLEIVIPVRNPKEVLETTIASLVAQTDRNFSVLISDNFSTQDGELIARAEAQLQAAGLTVRRVRPPEEVGRVEHWNWSHRQAVAEWIKPLFVGDWLEPDYVARIRAATAIEPPVDIINCSFVSHHADGTQTESRFSGGYRSPEQVLATAFREGNNFGGPINICFRRLAFELVGGYPPALPVSADFWLILMLALRKGLHTCPEALGHFNYHSARFSTNFPWGRIHGDRELFIILLAASSAANFAEMPANLPVRNRFFALLFRRTFKRWLKRKCSPKSAS